MSEPAPTPPTTPPTRPEGRRPTPSRRFGLGAKIILAAASAFIVLAAAEAALRVRRAAQIAADPFWNANVQIHRASEDPELIYELNPGAEAERDGVKIKINPQGFRDDPFPDEPLKDQARIVLVGDSVAWGWGVAMEDAFPQALERELQARCADPPPPHPVVLNLAVDGYSTAQEIRMIESRGLALEPDLIIVSYVMNDPDTYDAGLARYYQQRSLELLRPISNALWTLRNGRENQHVAGELREDYHFYIHTRYRDQTRRQFAELGRISRESGVPILVAVSPILTFKLGEPYAWQPLVDELKREIEANGLKFVDLRRRLGAADSDRWTLKRNGAPVDPWHPNAEGHLEIARELAEEVQNWSGSEQPRLSICEPRP